MIATQERGHPPALSFKADQEFFHSSLDRAAALVHGRHSHEGGPRAGGRRRLVLTSRIATTAPDASYPHALLWNPAGTPLDEALRALGVADGMVAVIGGTDVFGLFLGIGYDAFHLTRASKVRLPGGRGVFPGVPERTPEAILAEAGLRAGPVRVLDAQADLTLITWER